MMNKLVSTLLLTLLIFPALAHKHYMSIANMEYNPKLKQIEVSLKLTAHDFEHILEDKFKERIHIENVSDSSEVGAYIVSYLAKHLNLVSANQSAKFNYVGKEVTLRDELFFYFTFTEVLDPSHIIIANSILFQLFSKQQNLIHYKYMTKTKSVTCVTSLPEGTIKFDD